MAAAGDPGCRTGDLGQLLALGAYLEWGADRPRHDLRKPLIILGCMAAFLAFWGVALWRRSRRNRLK